MKINARGLSIIKDNEKCVLEAYLDAVGILTIGFGHTEGVKKGQRITPHQADVILDYDLDKFEEGVTKLVAGTPVTSDEFSALVSLAFNIGLTALANSTLLKKLRAGDKQGAADEFLRWVRAGGNILKGLQKRREQERLLFLSIPQST